MGSPTSVNSLPYVHSTTGPLRDVHGVIQGRRRKETEVARRIKGGNEREGDRSS